MIGEEWVVKGPSNKNSRAGTETFVYFELDGVNQCIGGVRGLYADAAGEWIVLIVNTSLSTTVAANCLREVQGCLG